MTEDEIWYAGGALDALPATRVTPKTFEVPPAYGTKRNPLAAALSQGMAEAGRRRAQEGREEIRSGLSVLDKAKGALEGTAMLSTAIPAAMIAPFAKEFTGTPEDEFTSKYMYMPRTEAGLLFAEERGEQLGSALEAAGETPLGQALGKIAEKVPLYTPMLGAPAQVTGRIRQGTKLAAEAAGQKGKQILDEGQDLLQAARADFAAPPTGAIQLQAVQAPRSQLGMYSNAEQAALNLPQAKGTGNQFLAQLSKTPGVKPAELEWTGLSDFLKTKGEQPVTKAEIQDYLAANRVEVQEVRLGEGKVKSFEQWAEDEGLTPEAIRDFGPSLRNSYEAFKQNASQKIDAAKYAEYALPGGENYREILLTLPEDSAKTKSQLDALDAEAKRLLDAGDPRWKEVSAQRGELLLRQSRGTYKSPHYSQPNILAHMRLNDRTDADGNKVLFVEELQSDWGQSGRDRGFKTNERAELPEGTKVGMLPPGKESKFYVQLPEGVHGRNLFYGPTREQAIENAQNFIAQRSANPVPSAPFVQNTEDWLNLSVKRLITDAVNNGYDKVAFINGAQSAKRYDLSKQVNEIAVPVVLPDGSRSVRIDATQGKSLIFIVDKDGVVSGAGTSNQFDRKKLDEVIGKELTEKVMNAKEATSFKDLDLKVGGEGMQKFYDQIVPNTVNKLLKRLGGGKLDTVQLEDGMQQLGFTITPEMRELVKSQGLPMFAKGGAVKGIKAGVQAAQKATKAARQQGASNDPVAPEIKKTGKLAELEKELTETGGKRQGLRLQRAADEIPGLEDQYEIQALRRAFRGRKGYPYQGVMTMDPKEFQDFALSLNTPLSSHSKENIERLRNLLSQGGSFDDVPFLQMDKKGDFPGIFGHEGRHRTRALAAEKHPKTLVEVYPLRGLEMGADDEPMSAIEWLRRFNEELAKNNRYIFSEDETNVLKLPDVYADGGAVTMKKGGVSSAMQGINAAKQASKAARRQERVDKNLQRWSGSEEKPPVYYHATDVEEDFTVFDPTKSRTQAKASFFTPEKDFATQWVNANPQTPGRPLSPRVMPTYVRAKNTFDFTNDEHVKSVMDSVKLPESLNRESIADRLSAGQWPVIEDKRIQQAIKDQGFDSFFVKERGVKNLGVFNPGDIKSVFNRGSFSEDLDISKAEGGAINGRARARAQAHLKATKAVGGAINGRARARAQAYKNGGAVMFAPGGKVVKGAGAGVKEALKATKAARSAKQEDKPAYSPKVLESTTVRMEEQIRKDNPKLDAAQVRAKAERQAKQKLGWEREEKPALEKTYGELKKAPYSASLTERKQNVPEVVQRRIEETERFLAEPTEPWQPPRRELQAFDRERIKDALEGFPGIEQTKFPRYTAPRSGALGMMEEIYQDPVNRRLIEGQIKRGLPLGGETFYASLYPLKLAALERGIPESQFNQFIYSIAPASARNSIMNEMAVGQFLRDMNARGLSLDEESVRKEMDRFKQQYGTGLPLMPVHREGVKNVLEGNLDLREMSKANIPTSYKIPTYGTQKAGDFGKSMVLDVHEAAGQTRGSKYHPYFTEQGGFSQIEYGPAEEQMLQIAQDLGIPGGMAQAGRWFGGGELTGLKSPRGDALDLLEKQAAFTLHGQGIKPTPRNVRNFVLDMVETGRGELMPYFKKTPMPDYRTEKKKGGIVALER